MVNLLHVSQPEFGIYGRVITEIDFSDLIAAMEETPCPSDAVVYCPGDPRLEALPVAAQLRDKIFGEMPIQVGYCNGNNNRLNAVEYHHSSEVNVAATDMILLLGCVQDISERQTYHTKHIQAFFVPKGTAVEIYGTTLHYAPCSANGENFRVTIVLPAGTNLPLSTSHDTLGEDRLITAKNKWLIAHPDAGLHNGEIIGLLGENICV